MPIAKNRHIIYLLAVFLSVFWSAVPSEIQARQLPAQDVVLLVDCSKSLSSYLRPIAGIMNRFTSGARYGDSLVCYQFSNKVVLIARGRIEKPGDVAQLNSQLLQLHTAGKYTNYFPALQKGLAEIRTAYKARPANDRILILITDGRRDPGDTGTEIAALGRLLKRHSDLKAGRDYFFYCFYVGDWLEERDLHSYLLSAGAYVVHWPKDKEWLDRLTLAEVRIMDRTRDLGKIPDTPAQSTFSMVFHPRRPAKEIAMIELSIEAEFAEGTLDKFFDVRPRRFVCRQDPWIETFGFETRGFERGNFTGNFVFQPSEPQTLLLSPRIVDFSFSITESLQVLVPAPLRFGPTGFKGEYEETKSITITPSGIDFPRSLDVISVVADIELPEGLELNVSPAFEAKKIVIHIAVSRHRTLSEQIGGKYEGKIRLASPDGWTFTNSEIPITVDAVKKGFDFKAIAFYFGIASGCALAVVAILLASGSVRTAISDYLAHKTRPVGKLIVTDDPTKGIVRNINLARLSEKKRAKEFFIGTGEKADVELPHTSMIDRMYKFSGLKTQHDVHTVVEIVKGPDEVLVNNKSRTGRVQLVHRDEVKLGAFEFRYEVPSPLQQLVLYFLDGDSRQGWPLSWNTETEGFRFLDRADLPSQKESYVRFYELKAAAFVRDFDGELTKNLLSLRVPRSGHLVRLIFADDEELTGYVFDWKNLGDKFYFFPDSMGENILFFLIERHTLKDIDLLKEDARGSRLAQEMFRLVLEKLKKKVQS